MYCTSFSSPPPYNNPTLWVEQLFITGGRGIYGVWANILNIPCSYEKSL